MSLLDAITAIIAPYECLGCKTEGSIVCALCQNKFRQTDSRCYRCLTPSLDNRTCDNCRSFTPIARLTPAVYYETLARTLVHALKYQGVQQATRIMAYAFKVSFRVKSDVLLIPVPTSSTRIRARGYDQSTLLAKALQKRFGVCAANILARTSQRHQVGSTGLVRRSQLAGAFRVRGKIPSAKTIILVDDVVTTGATLEAAAKILAELGAHNIEAMVFARADKLGKTSVR